MLTRDDERSLYLEGIRLFNAREFFEAHEAWEDAWHMAYGLKHQYYQGIIQCAVALEHYRRSNARGVVSLHRSYRRRLAPVPERFMGLDVRRLLEEMERALAPVIALDPPPPRGSIRFDPQVAPMLRLLYDPFETGEAQRYNRPDDAGTA